MREYAAVLVDHRLRDGSGLSIIQNYARLEIGPPFIMLTAEENIALAVAAMRAGALDYVSKESDLGFLEVLPVVIGNAIDRMEIRARERRLQREIAEAEQRLGSALKSSPIPTLLVDTSGKIHLLNRAWQTAIGIKTALGINLDSLLFATFVDPDAVRDALELAESNQSKTHAQVVAVKALDGSERTWRLFVSRLDGDLDNPTTPDIYICHGLDISDSIRLEQQLRVLSLEDPLTGLPNRRSLSDRLPAETARARREQSPLAVAMIDIDSFKAYNDAYGHLAGDRCLTAVAATIKSTLKRPADYVARYGGEEFAVLLPGTTEKGATEVLEEIRAAVRGLHVPHERSVVSEVVTVSIGFAVLDSSSAGSPEKLIGAADTALFQAKEHGRDRVAQYRPERKPAKKKPTRGKSASRAGS
jgi:diguanylate cyclase (GGDEF)-like protein/PAS domain S-box-containing protein